ncbi:MAG: dipeptidase [Omnitrophica WOR_2 bacterium]
MTHARQAALQYAHEHKQEFLEALTDFASIPSVSTESSYQPEIQKAAEWVAGYLRKLGIDKVRIFATGGHPVVYGESLKAGPDQPTALIYGHYDVQPAEPLELWESGAFEPAIRGENIFARGISDMKGQVLSILTAVESIIRTGNLPINLKFLFEGEEEIGSPDLGPFINEHKDLLACDFAINPDTGIIAPDVPSITVGLRGLAYYELRVYGPDHDLHSGMFGGAVHNPAQVLCELIAGMHDSQGKVTLPGFYDQVLALQEDEKVEMARLPVNEATYLAQSGAPALWGEEGFSPAERVTARPTLEVNGLLAGYTGPGTKTVLPAKAMAKISMRLVPNQDPQEVGRQLLRYLEAHAPGSVRWEILDLTGSPASLSDRNSPAVQAISKAIQTVWGKSPLFKREGGSVPVVTFFKDILKVESVNTGFGLPEDNAHSPNEKLHLPTWYKGIDTFINFFFNIASEK